MSPLEQHRICRDGSTSDGRISSLTQISFWDAPISYMVHVGAQGRIQTPEGQRLHDEHRAEYKGGCLHNAHAVFSEHRPNRPSAITDGKKEEGQCRWYGP